MSVPLTDWPQRDQDALDRAFAYARLKGPNGKFRKEPTEKYRANVTQALEQLWAYQNANGIAPDTSLVERVKLVDSIIGFYEMKRKEGLSRSKPGKPGTPVKYLERIDAARDRLLIGQTDHWFKDYVSRQRYSVRGLGERKTAPLASTELYELAIRCLSRMMPVISETDADLEVYIDYQTALMIGVLSLHPGRSQDLIAMEVGDWVKENGNYVFLLSAQKNRGDDTVIRDIAGDLAPLFTFFLDRVRPELDRKRQPKLWVADDGDALPQTWFARQFSEMIMKETGVHMTPHQVRNAAATAAHAAGFDRQAMAAILTETDLRRATRTYSSYRPQYAATTVAILEALLAEDPGN